MTKGTFSGTKLKVRKKIGFRARMSTVNGRIILKTRRKKGRKKLVKSWQGK